MFIGDITQSKYSRREIEMRKRVHFIGSGYESVRFVIVDAETNGEAIRRALEEYERNGWDFHYCELEVERG